MRKNVCLLPIFFIPFISVKAQNAVYDGKLFGKIKTVRLLIYGDSVHKDTDTWPVSDSMVCSYGENRYQEKSFFYYFDMQGNIARITTDEFDSKGNIVKEVNYTPDNWIVDSIMYNYDQDGNLVKEVGYHPDSTIEYITNYSYGLGHLLQKETNETDSTFPTIRKKSTYQYDAQGNKTGSYEYWDGAIREEILYQYDSKGNIVKASHHCPDGSDFEIQYQYDRNGYLIAENRYQPLGVLLTKVTYAYKMGSKNNWKEKTKKEVVVKNNHLMSFHKFRQQIEYYH